MGPIEVIQYGGNGTPKNLGSIVLVMFNTSFIVSITLSTYVHKSLHRKSKVTSITLVAFYP